MVIKSKQEFARADVVDIIFFWIVANYVTIRGEHGVGPLLGIVSHSLIFIHLGHAQYGHCLNTAAVIPFGFGLEVEIDSVWHSFHLRPCEPYGEGFRRVRGAGTKDSRHGHRSEQYAFYRTPHTL